jgi:electron transfer flavoprotein alpha subunit
MKKNIIIIAEHINGRIAPNSFETAACAQIIQNASKTSVKIIIAGHEILPAASQLAIETGFDVILVTDEKSAITQTETLKAIPSAFYNELKPLYILIPHNSFGMEIASGLAMKLNAKCISGVEKIIFHEDQACFQRKIFNDKIIANIDSDSSSAVLTIQPGAFKPLKTDTFKPGNVRIVTPIFLERRSKYLGVVPANQDATALAEAEVIVSAGNGIGKEDNLGLIHQLAGLFPKSAVAGSRPVCDKRWLPYHQQVGVTGATVRPKLYMACGISGASQHIAGMRDSKFIVSINTDPKAAIFQYSDVCIIEDLSSFIPEFINARQKSLQA